VAAKAKTEKASAASSRDDVMAVDAEVRSAQRDAKRAADALLAKQAKAILARKEFENTEIEKARRKLREDVEKATVQVIVQTRKSRPVRTKWGEVPLSTPVKVPRRALRYLQGMAQRGKVQLIVGELNKPGELIPRTRAARTRSKAKPSKES
jgi:hypothetical protein